MGFGKDKSECAVASLSWAPEHDETYMGGFEGRLR